MKKSEFVSKLPTGANNPFRPVTKTSSGRSAMSKIQLNQATGLKPAVNSVGSASKQAPAVQGFRESGGQNPVVGTYQGSKK